ncbi:MAG: hypothetical protein GC200_01290 [Tepidisphaera sp.]|nr:hypothetical protein [Tepidisphaera sp.]
MSWGECVLVGRGGTGLSGDRRAWQGWFGSLLLALIASIGHAQCGNIWNPIGGGGGPTHADGVFASVMLPNGDVLAGGGFSSDGDPDNFARVTFCRYFASTNTWNTTDLGVAGEIRAMVLLPDGDVLVGGLFRCGGSFTSRQVARYHPSTSTWTPLATGGASVYALAVLPSGDIVAGGRFTTIDGVAANHVAKFNSQSGTWSALGSGTNNNLVYSAVALADGSIVFGGDFTIGGGLPANRIARFDLSTGTWSAFGSGLNGPMYALVELPDGRLLVGGSMGTAGGVTVGGIATFDRTTGQWGAIGSGTNGGITGLGMLPDGRVLVGGTFNYVNGVYMPRIAICNPNTGTWAPAIASGTAGVTPNAIQRNFDGTYLVSGLSRVGNLYTPAGVTKFDPVTASWSVVGGSFSLGGVLGSQYVNTLAPTPDGDVIAGGYFDNTPDGSANYIARFHPQDGHWTPLGSGVDDEVLTAVTTLDGDVIVGGFFYHAGSALIHGMARYSPTDNQWSALNPGVTGVADRSVRLLNGDIVLSGWFTATNGLPLDTIARYRASTGEWFALQTGLVGHVFSMLTLPNGDLVVSGGFTSAGGVPARYYAKYNLETDSWSAMGVPPNRYADSLALLPNGDLVAAGSFSTIGGMTSYAPVARYNFATGVWSGFEPVDGRSPTVPYTLAILPAGDIVLGGFVYPPDWTSPYPKVARWSASDHAWHSLGTGLMSMSSQSGRAFAATLLPSGDVMFGGSMTVPGGVHSTACVLYHSLISMQPQPVETCTGSMAGFQVATTDDLGSLSYQWRKNGVALDVAAHPSASTPTLTLNGVQSTDAGEYDCVITAACGDTISDGAVLTLLPPYSRACGGPGCDADLNADGVIDQGDIDYLINAIAGGGNPSGIDTDFNQDGASDQTDVDALINVVAGGDCP